MFKNIFKFLRKSVRIFIVTSPFRRGWGAILSPNLIVVLVLTTKLVPESKLNPFPALKLVVNLDDITIWSELALSIILPELSIIWLPAYSPGALGIYEV